MIFRVKSENRTFWFPIYCINDTTYQSTEYLLLGIFEIFLYLFAGYAIVQSVRLLLQITVFHYNMNYMMAIFLVQWFEAVIAKLIILPYEYGFILIGDHQSFTSWYTLNKLEMYKIDKFDELFPLYIAAILLWHYIYTILIGVVAIGFERACATFYIHDYESTSRWHIPIILITMSHLFSLPFAYYMANNMVSFFFAFGIFLVFMSTVTLMFVVGWRVNANMQMKLESDQTSNCYTLAQQFQIKENYKAMRLGKRLVKTAIIYSSMGGVLLIILILNLVPSIASFANHMFLTSVFLNPITICPVLMSCSKVWQIRFWNFGRIRLVRSDVSVVKPTVNETDVYFMQLRNSWI